MVKEYRGSRWHPLFGLGLAVVYLVMVIVALALGVGRTRTFTDAGGREIVYEPSLPATDMYLLYVLMLGVGLTIFLVNWNYRIVLSDDSLLVQSLLLDREVTWSGIRWCHVYGKHRVVVGSPKGRALPLKLEMCRGRREALEQVTSRVPSVRHLRTRWEHVAALLLVACGGAGVAFLDKVFLVFVLAAAVGVGMAFAFVSMEPRLTKKIVVQALVGLYLTIAAQAVAIGVITRGTSVLSTAKMTVVLFGGWLYGFSLTRMHEGAMRGVIGPDWAREVKRASESVVE